MKAALIFLGIFALAVAVPTGKVYDHHPYHVADDGWLKKEYEILRLFKHVHQHSYYKDYEQVLEGWDWEKHWDWYSKPEVAKHFWHHYQHGMLPRGEIFSVFHHEHLEEAIALFKVFYYAKNWEYFWKTAVWARQHVNEGQFIYAFSVAVIHRPDTEHLVLPPIHETYPYFFFPSETIHHAHQWKQEWHGAYPEQTSGYKGHTIHSNYSGWYLNLHPEQQLSYFTEDVGVNSFYYYYNLYYPFWLDSKEFHVTNYHRGEQFYYVHQQLLARYYLERLPHNLGEIPSFDWDWPIETGYYPSLHYYNGLEFPSRPAHAELYHKHYDGHQSHAFYYKNYTWSSTYVHDYERRIRDAIDLGLVWREDGSELSIWDPHGFETLGNLIESNPDSPNARFYGNLQVFARYFLGFSHYPLGKYQLAPSVLEHFETSLRDPVFYQFFKRIVAYFQKHKINYAKPYTHDDLYFKGVKIDHVEFEELVTYFDHFYSDLSNAVYVTEKEFTEDSVHVRVSQKRLNYKPFTYKVHVHSEKPVDSIVRVFIGPKHDEYGRVFNVTSNRLNFVEFDRFTYKLKAGANVISRNSYDNWYAHDYETYDDLYHHVVAAMEGKHEFHVYDHDYYYGFPTRFLLPHGSEHGFEYQFYFHISEYFPEKLEGHTEWYWPVGFLDKYIDGHSYGYPFDRPIHHEWQFHVPNGHFHTVEIFHKEEEHINAPHH